jgi:hypothetical protein
MAQITQITQITQIRRLFLIGENLRHQRYLRSFLPD